MCGSGMLRARFQPKLDRLGVQFRSRNRARALPRRLRGAVPDPDAAGAATRGPGSVPEVILAVFYRKHSVLSRLHRMGLGGLGLGLQSCPISGRRYSASGGSGPAGCWAAANKKKIRTLRRGPAASFGFANSLLREFFLTGPSTRSHRNPLGNLRRGPRPHPSGLGAHSELVTLGTI